MTIDASTSLRPGAAAANEPPLIEVVGVSKNFINHAGVADRIAGLFGAGAGDVVIRAVSDVSFRVSQGEVAALVGESGCGKSTLGRMVAGIMPPSAGEIRFRGKDVAIMDTREARQAALAVQMIFQDPFASLNPRMRVADIIGEAPQVHGVVSSAEADGYVDEIMRRVGLDPGFKRRYPHQFSGGQRQRIGVARALAVKPRFLVCDEAVAALDVSIQAQILNLFIRLREELGLTYLFISHDLGVVRHLSDRVMVMYLGRIVEEAPTEALFDTPNHPYTQALLREVPRIDSGRRLFQSVRGEIPSPLAAPPGCHFHPRCPHAMPVCREVPPPLLPIAPGRLSACHLNAMPV